MNQFHVLQVVAQTVSLTDFCLVLYFASILFTTGSMRQYLQPIQVAQVVQLLQDGTSIHGVARRFAVSPSSLNQTVRNRLHEGGMRAQHPLLVYQCLQPNTVQLNSHLPENSRIGRFTIVPRSLHR